jgi:hypothetical protein
MLLLMGACISRKTDEHFSMKDLHGMEKYYSLMPKRKGDIIRWITDSKGPWKTPDSFSCLQQIDAKMGPIKVSNDDEIRIQALKSASNIDSDGKQSSSLHIDLEKMSMTLNPGNSNLSIISSADVNNGPLLDWPTDW